MAGFASPMKNYNWFLQCDGLNAFQCQEFTPPTREWNVKEHGAPMGLPNIKTPGKIKVGQATLTKLKPAFTADPWVGNWFSSALAGGGERGFLRTIHLVMADPIALVTIERYIMVGAWPSKIELPKLVTKSDDGDNLLETVTFECQMFFAESEVNFAALFGGGAAQALGIAFPFGNAG